MAEEDELNYVHMFDFGVSTEDDLLFKKHPHVRKLIVFPKEDSLSSIFWDKITEGSSTMVMIKLYNLDNE